MNQELEQYAIIKTGGKQYRVTNGEKVRIEKLEQNPGDEVRFSDVLFVRDGDKIQAGQPTVAGAEVLGEVVRQMKAPKLIVYKKKPKKGYQKMQGHRQALTEVLIKSVQAGS